MSNGWDLRTTTPIPVGVIGEVDYVKVAIKKLMVNGLLVAAFVIDEPNTIETVHSAVIAHAKNAAVLLAKGMAPPFIHGAHH
jgi:hypothetical protein